MAKDDYFRLVYAILKELYECKKAGEKAELSNISPQRFKIPDSYWLDIICNQIDEGRIKGIKYAATKTGRTVTQTGDLDITRAKRGESGRVGRTDRKLLLILKS